jgi:type IV fimbrial biogenesis protein FimT
MNRTPARNSRGGTSGALRSRIGRGITLVESLVCLATVAVTLGTVLPGFGGSVERRRVEGAAAQLETDLYLTRALAVAQNRTLRFEIVGAANGGSCYVVHSGSAGDCACAPQGATCVPGVQVHRSQHFAADAGVRIAANVRSMVFEPTRGTVTPTGTLRVEGPRVAVHQVVNIMGRVRACTPSAQVPGYAAC